MKNLGYCLRSLWTLGEKSRFRMLLTALLGIVRVASSLLFVWVCKALVDIVTLESEASLGLHIGILAGVMLTQLLCNIGRAYVCKKGLVLTQNHLRERLLQKVMDSRWTGRERYASGDAVNRLEEDIRVVSELLCTTLPEVAVTLFQLIAASAYLLVLSPSLAWVLLVLMLVAVVGSRLFFRTLRKLTSRIRSTDSEVQQIIQENIQNRVLALTLSGTAKVVQRLSGAQNKLEKLTVSRLKYNSVARAFLSLGFAAGYAAAFLWGVLGIKSGAVTFGMMTAFLQLVGQVQRPVADMASYLPSFIHALSSIERLMELDELPQESSGPLWLSDKPCGVRFDKVCFSYDSSEVPVLKDFSFDFAPSSMTAVIGRTGIGKSTLVRLALGLVEPGEGSVSVYDSLQSLKAGRETRPNFMYVPQGNSLMSGTIRDNLLLACPGASEERMLSALHTACADFVLELPEGLESLCGESGAGLSEGQSQRVAIARALLHPGSILLLDEATSALDPATEKALLENLHNLSREGKTIIFVSHREAVINQADKVLNLEILNNETQFSY